MYVCLVYSWALRLSLQFYSVSCSCCIIFIILTEAGFTSSFTPVLTLSFSRSTQLKCVLMGLFFSVVACDSPEDHKAFLVFSLKHIQAL